MNENKQIVINAEAGTKEVIIREGAAPKLLDPKHHYPATLRD